eukprot:12431465-Karenia_brevis.AAC.1
MVNQISGGYRTHGDWPECLREANGIPEKIQIEPPSRGRLDIHTPAFLSMQDVAQMSSDDPDSSSEAKPVKPGQACEPEDIPDWTNECGRLVLNTGEMAEDGFIDTHFHWDLLEEQYSRDQLLDAAFVPYKDFHQLDYCLTHEPWLHWYRRVLKLESRMAITLMHASAPQENLRHLFAPMCHYLCIGHEFCEGLPPVISGFHMHCYLQLKERRRVLDIYRLVRDSFRNQYYGLPEVWKLVQCSFRDPKDKRENMDAIYWIRQCKKDNKYFEYGKPYDDMHDISHGPTYQQDESTDAELRHASETEGGSQDNDTMDSQSVHYFV